MGKYTLPVGVSRIIGSRQGATFQKSGKVFAIRKRSVIVQKRSSKQSLSKNSFAHQAQKWRQFTSSQKTSFTNQVTHYPRTNSLGNSYNLKGFTLQISSNIFRRISGLTELTASTAPTGAPPRILGALDFSQGSFIVNTKIFPLTVSSGYRLLLYLSRPLPASTTSIHSSDLKYVHQFAPGATTNSNYYALYTAVFSPYLFNAGLRIFVKMVFIQQTSGQPQLTLTGSNIIV
jgi:hypothetical protein